MLRLLAYIIFFLVGYKIIRELLTDQEPQKATPQSPERQNIHFNGSPNKTSADPSKFNSAESIDYEEVK